MPLRTILHPTDYSELSKAALRFAVEEARTHGARLIILHAVETLGPEGITHAEASQLQPESFRNRLWAQLRRIRLPNARVPVEYVLAEDDPAEAIVCIAAERECDLIVMGSHGRQGWERMLVGSVAEKVMRTAPCPVLVVKLPKEAAFPIHGMSTELHPYSLRG